MARDINKQQASPDWWTYVEDQILYNANKQASSIALHQDQQLYYQFGCDKLHKQPIFYQFGFFDTLKVRVNRQERTTASEVAYAQLFFFFCRLSGSMIVS